MRTRLLAILLLIAAAAAILAPAPQAAPVCSISWDGGAGTSEWTTAANWSTDAVPVATSDVCLNEPGGVTVTVNGTAAARSVQGSQTLRLQTGTLTVGDTSGTAVLAAFEQSGGTLDGAGTVRAGTVDLGGGNQAGSGLLKADGATHIHGNLTLQFNRRLETAGGQWTSGEIWARNRVLWTNTGTFELASEAGELVFSNWDSTTPATLRNTGTLVKSTGTGSTGVGWAIENDGTVSAESGTLRFKGGGGNGTGTFASPGGALTFESGTFRLAEEGYDGLELTGSGRIEIAAGDVVSGGDLTISGGTVAGNGTLESTGQLELTGGSMADGGLTRSTGTARIAGNVQFQFDRRFETHDGEWTSGELWARNRVLWTNTGSFDMRSEAGSAVFSNWDGTTPPTIRNTGTIVRSSGDGTTTVGWAIDNDGTVDARAGRLRFSGGGGESTGSFGSAEPGRTELAGGTFSVGAGTYDGFEVTGSARLNVAAGATYSGEDLWQSGGTIGGTGTLETAGDFHWTGGTMDGAGLTRSTGFTRIAGNVQLQFDRRIETRDGEWVSGEIWSRNRTAWLNTGTFDMRSEAGEAVFSNWDGTTTPLLRNTGTIVKTSTAGSETTDATTVGFALDNDGTVRTEAGTLRFTGGGGESTGSLQSVAPGRTVLAGGTFTVGSGSHGGFEVTGSGRLNVSEGATYTGGDLWQSGGTIGGAGTLETTGDFRWTGGTMDGTGLTRSTGTTTIDGNVQLQFDRRLQTHDGVWRGGEIWSRNRTVWTNTGTFDMRGETGEAVFSSWDGTARPRLVNTGTIVKTSTEGSDLTDDTTIGFALENDGTIRTSAGRLRFTGGGSGESTGAFESSGSGRTVIDAGSAVVVGGGTFAGLEISGSGRLEVAAGKTFSGTDLYQSGGHIGGAGTVSSSGTFVWSGGSMDGTGLTRNTGTTRITGNVQLQFDRNLETADGEWTAGQIWARNRATWTHTGTFDMRSQTGEMVFSNWDSTAAPRLLNTGTIVRSDGDADPETPAEDLHIGFEVDNDGTITSQSGVIHLDNGGTGVSTGSFGARLADTFTLGDGAEFTAGAEWAGSTLTIADGATVSMPAGRIVSGHVTGNGDIVVPSGRLEWTAGVLRGTGVLHVLPGAEFAVTGNSARVLRERRLIQNEGTLTWAGGNMTFEESSGLLNEGLLDATADGTIVNVYGVHASGTSSFVNTGTVRKAAGTGTVAIHRLENRGLVDIRSGTLYSQNYRQSANGRTLLTLAGTVAGTEHGVLSMSPGALSGTVAVRLADGYSPADGAFHNVVTGVSNFGQGEFTAEPLALPGGGTLTGAVLSSTLRYTATVPVPAAPRAAPAPTAAAEPTAEPTAPRPGSDPAGEPPMDAIVRLAPGRTATIALPQGTRVQLITRTKRATVRVKARTLRVKLRRGARGERLKLRYRLIARDGRRSKIRTLTVRIARRAPR